MEQRQAERVLEMLGWLLENPAEATRFCDWDEGTALDIQSSIENLEARGYYELILVLLLKNQEKEPIYRATAQYLSNRMSGYFRENGLQTELALFKGLLEAELAKRA